MLNKKVFVCHGGLFRSKGVKLDHIRAIEVSQPALFLPTAPPPSGAYHPPFPSLTRQRQRDIPPVAYSHNRWHDNLFEDLM